MLPNPTTMTSGRTRPPPPDGSLASDTATGPDRPRWLDHVTRRTIHDLLAAARARYVRIEPEATFDAMRRGALLIDTEPQRAAPGTHADARPAPDNTAAVTGQPSSSTEHPRRRPSGTGQNRRRHGETPAGGTGHRRRIGRPA
jgi:hypothetical protein